MGGEGCGAGGGRTRRNKRGRQQQAKRCRGGRCRQQTAAREVRKSAGGVVAGNEVPKRAKKRCYSQRRSAAGEAGAVSKRQRGRFEKVRAGRG